MSVELAAGCAFASVQSVSVVPMIQCRPHGMTNSTLFSVRKMRPVLDVSRSRGTTRWIPFDARTWNWPRVSASAWVSSVHTPVALMTCLARTSKTRPVSRSVTLAPVTRSPARRKPFTLTLLAASAPNWAAVRTSGQGVPGVVHLRVPVLDRAGERIRAQARRLAQRLLAGQVAVVLEPLGGAGGVGHRVVERDPGADVGPLPHPMLQRVQERDRPHQVRGDAVKQQPALAQRLVDQPEVEHLQVAQAAVDQLA